MKNVGMFYDIGTKAILKGWKLGLFLNFGIILCSWIRIRNNIPSTDQDPDPGETYQCGSGSVSATLDKKIVKDFVEL
jgi:hypothetical protein